MPSIPEDLTALVADLEAFLLSGLKGENLSKKAKEKRDVFIRRIKEIRTSYPQDFKDKREAEESDEGDEADGNNDGASLNSERIDKDEDGAYDGIHQSPPVAAQDLPSVFKAGYLEKRRKDHSFFGTEWQKRWCALSRRTFYYYGSEKDKQQKGDFCIDGYNVKMNYTLRKDAKKDCCFEISAPDKRIYQFCAASQKEAEDWVEQIGFVLKDGVSDIIPEEEDEHLMYDDVGNTNTTNLPPSVPGDGDDGDIYEELPEEDLPSKPTVPVKSKPPPSPAPGYLWTCNLDHRSRRTFYEYDARCEALTVNKSTDYKNFYQGIWDCTADHPDELSFKRGDTIYILSKEYQNFGWWVGEMKGAVGIVPKDYLMELYAI